MTGARGLAGTDHDGDVTVFPRHGSHGPTGI